MINFLSVGENLHLSPLHVCAYVIGLSVCVILTKGCRNTEGGSKGLHQKSRREREKEKKMAKE